MKRNFFQFFNLVRNAILAGKEAQGFHLHATTFTFAKCIWLSVADQTLADEIPLASACQEIVSGTEMRLSYADLGKRVRQLANSLKTSGIREGMRVGVMDWDTHRYLECFFAIPMMGASLFTINVRLSPAQVLYTINHGQSDLIIVHRDFMPLIDDIKSGFNRDIIILTDW